MNIGMIRSRQPHRVAWTDERLVHERAIALGSSVDSTSVQTYGSALNSYLEFCKLHNKPVEPTPDTLSFYTVFMCHHIEPRSVDSYLSGICNQLEPYFPNIREIRRSVIVSRTLEGCKRLRSKPVHRKLPLTREHLLAASAALASSISYDDTLWIAILFTGFHGLLRLGELCCADASKRRNPRKYCRRISAVVAGDNYSFELRAHKADRFFEGNRVLITDSTALPLFRKYLQLRDKHFPLNPFLWVRANGEVPTRTFFIQRLRNHIPDSKIAGQSMRAGGATKLAEEGAPPHVIQASGRWSSATFQIYIRKNPTLLHSMLRSKH